MTDNRAVLKHVNLTGADLRGANLTGAVYDHDTVWPVGYSPTAAGAVEVDR